MRILLIGHDSAKPTLRAITQDLRLHGNLTSCYYDDDLRLVNAKRDLPPTDILFIGVSHGSFVMGSPQQLIEADILERAIGYSIPFGVICDSQGNATPRYIVDQKVDPRIVIAGEPSRHASLHELWGRTEIIYTQNPAECANELGMLLVKMFPSRIPLRV